MKRYLQLCSLFFLLYFYYFYFQSLIPVHADTQCNLPGGSVPFDVTPLVGNSYPGTSPTAFAVTIHWSKIDPSTFASYWEGKLSLFIVGFDSSSLVIPNLDNATGPLAIVKDDAALRVSPTDKTYPMSKGGGSFPAPNGTNYYNIVISLNSPPGKKWDGNSNSQDCLVGTTSNSVSGGSPYAGIAVSSNNPVPSTSPACPAGQAQQNARCNSLLNACNLANPSDITKICAPGLSCDTDPSSQLEYCYPGNVTPNPNCPNAGTPCKGSTDITTCQQKGCSQSTNLTCQSVANGHFACEGPDVNVTPSPTFAADTPIPNPCKNNSCNTAIGAIDVSSGQAFVAVLFRLILSLSGGISLILIIYSGYSMSTSRGNAEKIQAAKETLTSAVIGLIFIIFSMTVLQIIGVDILGIFSK